MLGSIVRCDIGRRAQTAAAGTMTDLERGEPPDRLRKRALG